MVLGRECHDPVERSSVQLVTPVTFRVHGEFERHDAGARLEQLTECVACGRCVRHTAPLAQHVRGAVIVADLLKNPSDRQQRAALLVLCVLCGLRARARMLRRLAARTLVSTSAVLRRAYQSRRAPGGPL